MTVCRARGPTPRVILVLAVLAVALGGCAGTPSGSPAGAATAARSAQLSQRNVLVIGGADNRFHPQDFVLEATSPGRYEITFAVPTGGQRHTMQSDALKFDTGYVNPGEMVRFAFTGTPGTYEYYCRDHRGVGMVGRITLR